MAVPAAGSLIKASDIFNEVTFTPNWTNITQGTSPTNEGRYVQIGNWVWAWARLEFGTGSPGWSATVLMDLPVTALTGGATGLSSCIGNWTGRSSGSINYMGAVTVNSATGLQANFGGAWNGTSPSGRVGVTSSTPFTPVAANVFSCQLSYAVA